MQAVIAWRCKIAAHGPGAVATRTFHAVATTRRLAALEAHPIEPLPMKPFRIFRPGKHTASCGTQVEFTKEDLAKAVAGYAPSNYASPLVIGHPKVEDRAYGQVEKLSMDDDGAVWAHPAHVEPRFGDLVATKAFPNRSASWYMPDHPNNPTPGALYLKHIGFLGAAAPALKGLGDIEFADPVLQAISFTAETAPDKLVEFASTPADAAWSVASVLGSMARMLRDFRDQRIAEKGVESADELIPDYVIRDAEDAARTQREQAEQLSQANAPLFTEPTQGTTMNLTPEQIAQLQKDHEAAQARIASFTARETAIAAAEHMATVDAIIRELQPLVAAGQVLPAARAHLANFMAGLPDGVEAQTIEFGEADDAGAIPKVSPRAYMKAFLATLPKQVNYGEHSPDGTGVIGGAGAMTAVQLAETATAMRAQVKAETGREISYSEAANRVLAIPGNGVAATDAGAQV